jgi:hypothetical protein
LMTRAIPERSDVGRRYSATTRIVVSARISQLSTIGIVVARSATSGNSGRCRDAEVSLAMLLVKTTRLTTASRKGLRLCFWQNVTGSLRRIRRLDEWPQAAELGRTKPPRSECAEAQREVAGASTCEFLAVYPTCTPASQDEVQRTRTGCERSGADPLCNFGFNPADRVAPEPSLLRKLAGPY